MKRRPALQCLLLTVLALLLTAGCGTNEPGASASDDASPAVLAIEAAQPDPTGRADYVVDFGAGQVGDQLAAAFAIRNVGESELLLAPPSLAPPFGAEHSTDLVVQPGGSARFGLRFLPTEAGAFETLLRLEAGEGAAQVVRLTGTATERERRCALVVDERRMQWSEASVCIEPAVLELVNVGDAPCTAMLSVEGAAFGIDRDEIEIGPRSLEHVVVYRSVVFAPPSRGVLHVRAGNATWHVPLAADGDAGLRTDVIQTAPRPQIDFLFVVDDSADMAPFEATLKENLARALSLFIAQQLDFRIGVTTISRTATDGCEGSGADGRLVPLGESARWLTIGTPDLADRFRRAVDVGSCSTAPNQGLAAAWRTLSELDAVDDDPAHPEPGDGNAGFVREGALLSLVFISASDDLSPDPVTTWANRFLSIHGLRNDNLLSAHAIVAPPGGCGSASGGVRYRAIAEQLGGIVWDLCSADWSTALERIGMNCYDCYTTWYYLDDTPVDVDGDGQLEGDIQVRVDGAAVPQSAYGSTRWTYVVGANRIQFGPLYSPDPGSTVEVTYTPSCLGTPD